MDLEGMQKQIDTFRSYENIRTETNQGQCTITSRIMKRMPFSRACVSLKTSKTENQLISLCYQSIETKSGLPK